MEDTDAHEDERTGRTEDGTGMSRRRLLQTTALGAGAGAATYSFPAAGEEHEHPHDHAGDRLGESEPVESLRVNSIPISRRDRNRRQGHGGPGHFLVFEDGGTWAAYRPWSRRTWFEDTDGVNVINSALEASNPPNGNLFQVRSTGFVRVVADDGGTVLESDTTIAHEHHGVKLSLDPGVTFEYTGDDEAVRLEAGNQSFFSFDVIDANGADYCIRDVETGSGSTYGNTLRGASDTLWYGDVPEERFGDAGQYISIREFDCTANSTPYGFRVPSGVGSNFTHSGSEGYWVDIGAIRGPTETGIVVGDETPNDNIGFYLFDTYIDGSTNDATSLVELHDNENAVLLRGFTPATGGDWDVVMGDFAQDSRVYAVGRRSDLRVKRESLQAADLSALDTFSPEVVKTELSPESLEGYERTLSGSGDVAVRGEIGRVEHRTGAIPGSRAGVQRSVPPFSDVSFDQQAAIQTSVIFPEDAGYDAWLLWGDPDGQAVGWRVASDQLLGYVSDGDSDMTLPLLSEGDVNAGDAWNLTAFYNPPTDVVYYVDDLITHGVTTTTGAETSVIVDNPDTTENLPGLVRNRDARYAGRIASNLPAGGDDAHQVMSIELANIGPTDRRLQWSNWRNHRYPSGGAGA